MKKFLIYFILFIGICFILPAIFTQRNVQTFSDGGVSVELQESNNIEQNDNENMKNEDINIKLLHRDTGEVEEVKLEEYLCNVVSAEMPADYEIEALKAQAIVARTYTMYKIENKKHDNADICDDSACCQAWISKEDRLARWEESKRESNWEKIEKCVKETKGKIVTYQNKPINAFFHANSGGITELPVNVWGGGDDLPYLQVVETSGEEGYTQYASEVELSYNELLEKLKAKYQDIQIDFNNKEDIKIIEYTDSKRVKTVKFGNHNLSGVETRTLLGLRSTNFQITYENEKIKFSVIGYGHGVGMSQTGANTMAKEGKSCDDIIYHFYKDVEIKNVNSL